ncbi:MAG: hypothetical protein AAF961_09620, partial [Planctomycetota bacterium]
LDHEARIRGNDRSFVVKDLVFPTPDRLAAILLGVPSDGELGSYLAEWRSSDVSGVRFPSSD